MKLYRIFILVCICFANSIWAQIFVAPNGNDANSGTIDQPLLTLVKAITKAGPDSIIYLRGGVYQSKVTISTTKAGSEGKYIKVWAYPGEKPVLDFSIQTSQLRGFDVKHDYWYFKGLEVMFARDNGMFIRSGHNIVEQCIFHHNRDSGLQISEGGNNTIVINCDSYLNYDPSSNGGNADGFSPKLDCGGGNEFHGCRAWNNSDDGWDCYGSSYGTIIDSCWTFRNGINVWNNPSFGGNGNGFKVGGGYTVAHHKVTNCISFDNVKKGFDQNHNTGDVIMYNCTGWRNERNFWFYEVPVQGKNVFKNNLSYAATLASYSLDSLCEQTANSWQGFDVTDADFQSLDTALATAPRNPDGSLPVNSFLHLRANSSLINAGVDVGIRFTGKAPDLGAFENNVTAIEKNEQTAGSYVLHQNYPNPFNPTTTISYRIHSRGKVLILVYNTLGKQVACLENQEKGPGTYKVVFDGKNLPSGLYLYSMQAGNYSTTKKMILIK